jgi:hypothetical protein
MIDAWIDDDDPQSRPICDSAAHALGRPGGRGAGAGLPVAGGG